MLDIAQVGSSEDSRTIKQQKEEFKNFLARSTERTVSTDQDAFFANFQSGPKAREKFRV